MMDRTKESLVVEKALGRFFARCNGVVGSEANYQAMLAAELERDFPYQVRREHRFAETGRGGIDVSVLESNGLPKFVFELKGGAYNSRNALNDVFSTSGHCSDMSRVAKLAIPAGRRWVVAVDAVELGRSLGYRQQQKAVAAANSSGVGFAYYGHGDDSFLLARPGQSVRYPEVEKSNPDGGVPVDIGMFRDGRFFDSVLSTALPSLEMEADVVGAIYRGLLAEGYTANQIALEAYYGFAPGTMHQKPDLCLFEPSIEGHFNLYPRGNVGRTYDGLKLSTLRTMVEVKGGKPLLKRTDSALEKIYREDIEKLGNWRAVIEDAGKKLEVDSRDVCYIMLSVDMRLDPLDERVKGDLAKYAEGEGVQFVYVHIPELGTEFSYAKAESS